MVPTRDWTPPLFLPPFDSGDGHRPREGTGTGEPQQRLRVDASFHQFRSPVWEGRGGVLAGRSGSGMERANAAGSSQFGEFSDRNLVDQRSAVPNSFSTFQI